MTFKLPELPYSHDALEPYIDKETMEVHHTKHHQSYLDKFNKVLENYPDLQNKSPEEILSNLNDLKVSDSDRNAIKNNGGGYVNHNIFWQSMSSEKQMDDNLISEIEEKFNSMENFKQKFSDLAKTHFGSGWAWLVRDDNKQLKIYSLSNQESPYTLGDEPIFCIDVWEHAYYLKYQNKRGDYVDNWWNVLKFF
ncbi:MAG: superoxide dismutase [Candidatus Magasanikbacteria bacterium]|nr:superoxide dismutase [Candidatus Magasanikbacteria bacterium]